MTIVFLTSGTTYTIPADWDSTHNSVKTFGGGGGGGGGGASAFGGGGGGGGAYSQKDNLVFSPGDVVTIHIGAAGSANSGTPGGDTWFNGASLAASSVGAKGGNGSISTNNAGATGGAASGGIGTTKFSGGNGANGGFTDGGGGGGAAGENGAGNNGSGSTGGSGDAGAGGTGGAHGNPGANGGTGTEYDGSHGAGGGAGGGDGNLATNANGGTGGQYGGGGGGGAWNLGGGAAGFQGFIVIGYEPWGGDLRETQHTVEVMLVPVQAGGGPGGIGGPGGSGSPGTIPGGGGFSGGPSPGGGPGGGGGPGFGGSGSGVTNLNLTQHTVEFLMVPLVVVPPPLCVDFEIQTPGDMPDTGAEFTGQRLYITANLNVSNVPQLITPTLIIDGVENVLPPVTNNGRSTIEIPISKYHGRLFDGVRLDGCLTGRIEIFRIEADIWLGEQREAA